MTGPSAQEPRPNEEKEAEVAEQPLSEPLIIQCLSVSGVVVKTDDNVVNFVGWSATPTGDGNPPDRRIVIRFDMPVNAIRPLRDALTKAIPRGH